MCVEARKMLEWGDERSVANTWEQPVVKMG
jgi:hypothetical protein